MSPQATIASLAR